MLDARLNELEAQLGTMETQPFMVNVPSLDNKMDLI